ncbi:NAD(P)-binding protein [Aspergillus steynii IBT 23096]|uniref:NAD(P)-binding protein n=1 Tax=Aspergillus steynii IBT 23096 TaxID=1392250 RepID=A0A2I2GMS1_9EURO|nr:NAD(P)-binding protein [Aspergillus steynii IBT 23096]PLB54173.1 NAD(P)-binding protein [Aspergillus steynii IBT 23096]
MALELSARQNTTNFTKVIHRTAQPATSPSRPELNQAGRTVLVTGGGTNIGFAIIKSFITAGVSTAIIAGRRKDVLDTAAAKLRAEIQEKGASTTVLTYTLDQANPDSVRTLWAQLDSDGIVVDTLVLNAAAFSEEKPVVELGAAKVWEAYEVNVRGPLEMVHSFASQKPTNRPRAIVNVASQVINMLYESQLFIAAKRPVYGMTKNAGAMLMQQIAKDTNPEELQIVSFHPGILYSDEFQRMGLSETDLPFDSADMPGSFAVWAATEEARFLHGRFVWASWDIEEYSQGELRKRIDENVDFLRVGVVGLRGGLIDN